MWVGCRKANSKWPMDQSQQKRKACSHYLQEGATGKPSADRAQPPPPPPPQHTCARMPSAMSASASPGSSRGTSIVPSVRSVDRGFLTYTPVSPQRHPQLRHGHSGPFAEQFISLGMRTLLAVLNSWQTNTASPGSVHSSPPAPGPQPAAAVPSLPLSPAPIFARWGMRDRVGGYQRWRGSKRG
jgi:hypothetical protein